MGSVLRELEGDMLVVDELKSGETENRLKTCLRSAVYNPLNKLIAKVIDSQTLESLIGTVDTDTLMYFI